MLSVAFQAVIGGMTCARARFRALRTLSSRGLQAGGHRFDPGWLHSTNSLLNGGFCDRLGSPHSHRLVGNAAWRTGTAHCHLLPDSGCGRVCRRVCRGRGKAPDSR